MRTWVKEGQVSSDLFSKIWLLKYCGCTMLECTSSENWRHICTFFLEFRGRLNVTPCSFITGLCWSWRVKLHVLDHWWCLWSDVRYGMFRHALKSEFEPGEGFDGNAARRYFEACFRQATFSVTKERCHGSKIFLCRSIDEARKSTTH